MTSELTTLRPLAGRVRLGVLAPGGRRRALLLSLGAVLLLSLALPDAADAGLTSSIKQAIQGAADGVFEHYMAGLFGKVSGTVTEGLVTWLTQIPNFDPAAAQPLAAGTAHAHIDDARMLTTMLAFGGLSAVLTLSVARYWISGLSIRGSGGIEAFEGVSRVLLAVALILLWPTAFRLFIALANSATHALLQAPSVKRDMAGLWGWTITFTATAFKLSAPVGVIVIVMVAVVFDALLLALIVMKIMLTAGTAALYVSMPIVLVLWPLEETSWLAKAAGRAFVVCLVIPLTWAVLFITFGSLGADFFTFNGPGGILSKLVVKPLATIAMLGLAVTIPRALARAALAASTTPGLERSGGGGGGGSFVGRTASYLAARRLDGLVSQQLPALLGGKGPASGGGGGGGASGGSPTKPSSVPGSGSSGGGSVAGAWSAAFGAHKASDGAFTQARSQAQRRFLAALKRPGESGARVAAARKALGEFTHDQQVAMAASAQHKIEGFAFLTANQESAPTTTPEQRHALSVLGGTPKEQLVQAFRDVGVWDEGGRLLGGGASGSPPANPGPPSSGGSAAPTPPTPQPPPTPAGVP